MPVFDLFDVLLSFAGGAVIGALVVLLIETARGGRYRDRR
jgi:hypothetical protein